MIWPANSVLRFHCQRALNGTGKLQFCVSSVNIKRVGPFTSWGGGVLSIEAIQSVYRTEQDMI